MKRPARNVTKPEKIKNMNSSKGRKTSENHDKTGLYKLFSPNMILPIPPFFTQYNSTMEVLKA